MILEEIVAKKRRRLAQAQATAPLDTLVPRRTHRPLSRALLAPGIRIIAEIKKASPSRGRMAADLDVAELARAYEAAGAAAISVLTEEDYFGGSPADLQAAARAVDIPILRKDFLVDPYQVREAAAWGASAVLLIAAILDKTQLEWMLDSTRREGLDALVEVHTPEELSRALAAGATILGINSRDLKTLNIDLGVIEHLAPLVPPGHLIVAESGISGAPDVRRLASLGVRAFLVGEALMRSSDPGAKIRELICTEPT